MWKHSWRLIPSDFLLTRWANLCLMNALMGGVYCEECQTGCPCGSHFDIITQICQCHSPPLLSTLHEALCHLHTHRYSDISALVSGRRMSPLIGRCYHRSTCCLGDRDTVDWTFLNSGSVSPHWLRGTVLFSNTTQAAGRARRRPAAISIGGSKNVQRCSFWLL